MTSRHINIHKIFSDTSIVVAIILMVASSGVWFFWYFPYTNYIFIIFIFLRILVHCSDYSFRISKISFFFFLIVLWIWNGVFKSDTILIKLYSFLVLFCPLLFIYMMKFEEKVKLVNWTLNLYASFFLMSLITLLLIFVGIPIPNTIIIHPINETYPPFLNYYLLLVPMAENATRFNSVLTEPGHLGMFSAMFLYIDKFQFKKVRNIIFLISLLLSFSFAGYVLFVVGWIIANVSNKHFVKRLTGATLLLVIVCGILETNIEAPNGEGIISSLILSRAELDEEKGFAGNNRTQPYFDKYYENLSFSDYFFGLGGTDDLQYHSIMNTGGNNSYQVYIMQNGLLGILILYLFFFNIVRCYPSKLGYGMFLLYGLSFLQRTYWLWGIESYLFICAATIFHNHQHNLIRKSHPLKFYNYITAK